MLDIKVREIKGKCPVYKVGDRIVIDDPFRRNFASLMFPVLL